MQKLKAYQIQAHLRQLNYRHLEHLSSSIVAHYPHHLTLYHILPKKKKKNQIKSII
jgi:hypothetical protein